MTNPTQSGSEHRLLRSVLPWLIAVAGLAVYVLTLNKWVSFTNLPSVAKSSGWTWTPDLLNPLYFLVTYPVRWLPAHWIPLALNLFSLLCGVLTLALLARSVMLLPHNRTEAQRTRERSRLALLSIPSAWVPPVLAAMVLGLQLTFWEGTTNGSGEMFELLLLAYVIRNILEFRISENENWLYRAALVFAAGMANGWLMFCLFPLFVIAIVWVKGLAFFNARFVGRITLFGLAGLLLYLVLPLVHVTSDTQVYSFWEALKTNLLMDKNAFMHFVRQAPKNVLLLLALTSFLPLLVIGIRWPSNFGDPSRVGSALATWIFHLAHAALLVTCVWIAFDPVFSPRNLGYPLPAFYYLAALSVGYFSGYFLLVFRPVADRMGRTSPVDLWLHRVAASVVYALLLVAPAGLFLRNLPQIKMTNGSAMQVYASHLAEELPENAVVLSDDSRKLTLAQAWFARSGKNAGNCVFLDTQSLPFPRYHGFLQQTHEEWPLKVDVSSTNKIEDIRLKNLLLQLSQTRPVYYLEHSFGYYFEDFDPRPRGLVLAMHRYPTNSLSGPPLAEQEIEDNENFWRANRRFLDDLAAFIKPPEPATRPGLHDALLQKLHIRFEPNQTAAALGRTYSEALNVWGVELQRAQKVAEATTHFEAALALNANNLAAKENLQTNRDLLANRQPALRTPRSPDEELGVYRNWQDLLRDTGPFDDPTHCFGLGIVFAHGGLVRQAAHYIERVHDFAPTNLPVQLLLARMYVLNRFPEKALTLLQQVNARSNHWEAAGIRKVEVFHTEATALLSLNRTNEADSLLAQAIQNNPKNPNILAMAVQVSSMFGRLTNAAAAADRLLELAPDDPGALTAKGSLDVRIGKYDEAIPVLTRAIAMKTNNHSARLFRALAHLRKGDLAAAKDDYEHLEETFPESVEVNSGLAEIAWQRQDTNAAIHYYQLCVSNTPPSSEQHKYFSDRLESLRTEAR